MLISWLLPHQCLTVTPQAATALIFQMGSEGSARLSTLQMSVARARMDSKAGSLSHNILSLLLSDHLISFLVLYQENGFKKIILLKF